MRHPSCRQLDESGDAVCFGVEKFRGRPPVAVVCLAWSASGWSAEAEAGEIVEQPAQAWMVMHA
tara:strand:+ start:152 stop:343 length:192 start_codon:yes stop_codon:yes gene_type:complete